MTYSIFEYARDNQSNLIPTTALESNNTDNTEVIAPANVVPAVKQKPKSPPLSKAAKRRQADRLSK